MVQNGLIFKLIYQSVGCLPNQFLYLTVGAFLELVETLLDKASTVFDIKIFWVPSAFFRLSQEKLIIKNMRVDYRTVRYAFH